MYNCISTPGCCKILHKAANKHNFTDADKAEFLFVAYTDTLPFSWNRLNASRKPLREYRFFGGSGKSIPFPRAVWF